MSDVHGFLVVLRMPAEPVLRSNPKYRGVDRLPPYPSPIPEEAKAIDAYVFGDYKNDQGLIPSLGQANDLLRLFRSSPRQFELIYCCAPRSEVLSDVMEWEFLGVDVAGIGGDCWSIVGDMPFNEEMDIFRKRLNHFGLLPTYNDATEYLEQYRVRKYADYDTAFSVVSVYAPSSD